MKFNKDSDLKQATQNDIRFTGIGKFIRKTSIDEFPQFLNVFKGEMSFGGTTTTHAETHVGLFQNSR
jgi:putative colanic acid biosynthesis UDP-glucose lipid carrier transferase